MAEKLHFQFLIAEEDAGRRLDEFLWSRFGALSRMRITNLITEGACLIHGSATRAGYALVAGDRVEIAFEDTLPTAMNPEAVPLEIVYEDDQLIVVVKPAGVVVHPTKHIKSGTLANALVYYFNRDFYDSRRSSADGPAHGEAHSLIRPGIVHRLDRATSGLMVVARTARSLSVLTRHFQRRLIEKHYLALVDGRPPVDAGTIIAPIGRDEERQPRWWVMDGGKPAETRFRVLERILSFTLLELEPVTGRTNQLRIHCAYSGYPILGDEIYTDCGLAVRDQESVPGRGDTETRRRGDGKPTAADRPPRLCLHASRLAFHHPATGEWMQFESPMPADIAAFLDRAKRLGDA